MTSTIVEIAKAARAALRQAFPGSPPGKSAAAINAALDS
jgi:hypothetical protein